MALTIGGRTGETTQTFDSRRSTCTLVVTPEAYNYDKNWGLVRRCDIDIDMEEFERPANRNARASRTVAKLGSVYLFLAQEV